MLTSEWYEHHKLHIPFHKSDPSMLVTAVSVHSYSTANVRQLEAIALSFIWSISFDDEILETATCEEDILKYKCEFLKHFDSKNLDEALSFSIYCYMILQVFFKLEPFMSRKQAIRFREDLELYIDGAAKEVRVLRTSGELNYEEFLEVRLLTSCSSLYELYAEICNQIDMSNYFNDELFRKNKHAVTAMEAYVNDIYSYNKELLADFKGNLVYQTQKHFNCSSKEAMDVSIRIFGKEKEIFDETAAELIEKYSSNQVVKKYVSAMQNWIYGNIVTHKYYPRYSISNRKAMNDEKNCK